MFLWGTYVFVYFIRQPNVQIYSKIIEIVRKVYLYPKLPKVFKVQKSLQKLPTYSRNFQNFLKRFRLQLSRLLYKKQSFLTFDLLQQPLKLMKEIGSLDLLRKRKNENWTWKLMRLTSDDLCHMKSKLVLFYLDSAATSSSREKKGNILIEFKKNFP